jgi:integrase/recombinase XerC
MYLYIPVDFFMPTTAFLEYLSLEKNYSQHTVAAYKKDLQQFSEFLAITFDDTSLDEVSYPLIRNWIVSLIDQGISNRTVNRKVSSLKAFYKFLLKTHQISVSPLAKHKALRTAKKVQVPFSQKEVASVLEDLSGADDFATTRDKLVVELFYSTGMRRSELINLRLKDVQTASAQIKVLGKRNKERLIPMLLSVKKTIQAYVLLREQIAKPESDDYFLLTNKGLKLYETLVYRIINTYFSKTSSKVKKSPHILRHSFATHLLNEGADLNAVKELLGHASLASTQVYTHNSIAELQKVHSKSHPRNKGTKK